MRSLSAVVVVVVAASCVDEAAPPPANVGGPVCIEEGAPVDVLFVVDDSSSFAGTQERLFDALGAFVGPLVASGRDYHVGVTTTDGNAPVAGVLRGYDGAGVAGCAGCRFLTPAVACADATLDVAGLSVDERDALLLERCPAWHVLGTLMSAGIEGSAFEQGFAAAAVAVGAEGDAPAENVGFRRAGAPLHIVFITNEEEGDKDRGIDVRFFARLFEPLAGAGREQQVAVSSIVGMGDAIAPVAGEACAILSTTFDDDAVNDDPRAPALLEGIREYRNGCIADDAGTADEPFFAETGGRYIELACRTGGAVANLCEDLSNAFATVAGRVLERCVDGTCIDNAPCGDGAVCGGDGCVDGACALDVQCPLGSVCSGANTCEPGCRTNGDCGRGFACELGACVELCIDDGACPVGFVCGANECELDTRGPYCEPCVDAGASCDGGANFCFADGDGAARCGVDCGLGQACASGYECVRVIVAPPTVPTCSSDADCPSDVCVGAAPGDPGVCEISRRACFENFECDVITCVDGGCLIGANCRPSEGLTCSP